MAGILDFLGESYDPFGGSGGFTRADQLGLLGRALAGFGAGLNSGQRGLVNNNGVLTTMPSNNWGAGFSGMSDAYSQGMNDLTRRALTGSQMKTAELNRQKSQYELDQAKQQQAARDEFTAAMQSGDPARISAARQKFDPNAAYAEKLAEKAPLKLGEGDTLVDPRSFKPLYQGQPKQSDVERELRAAGIDPGSPEGRAIIVQKLTKPLVQTMAPIELKYDQATGERLAKVQGDIQNSGIQAVSSLNRLGALEGMLDQVNTGKYAGNTLELKKAAKSIGIDLTALGVKDDVAPAEAARALSNQVALELRNPSGGAGMPGALSDSDRAFLQQSTPSIENTPQGYKTMIEVQRRLQTRNIEVAKMARAYAKEHGGRLDDNFQDVLGEYSAKHPLFADMAQQTAPAAQAQPSVPPPAPAIQMLRSNPALAPQFDAKYGPGAARRILGQ